MLDRFLALLPASVRTRAKAIVAAAGALAALLTLVVDGEPAWLTKAAVVAMALGVYVTPNLGYSYEPTRPESRRLEPPGVQPLP